MQLITNKPEDFAQTGLGDDFDGVVTRCVAAPSNYDDKLDHYIPVVAVTFLPDEDTELEEFTQIYSLGGSLEDFQPSLDGEEPVDLDSEDPSDWEGHYYIAVGDKTKASTTSNWAHFMSMLLEAGFPKNKVEADYRFLVGTYGHWNRIPQKKRSGLSGDEKERQILVLTEFKELREGEEGKKKGKVKTKVKAKAKKEEETEEEEETGEEETETTSEDSDVRSKLEDAIITAIADSGGTLPKSKLTVVCVRTFKGDANGKKEAISLVNDNDFLTSSSFTYDAKKKVLSL